MNFNGLRAAVGTLLQTADRGILYRQGLKLVLAGRPNVGKSSLLNALLRAARAIVTPIPGTTRDVIEETLNLRGIPVRAMDTAGLRETEDVVEKLGVARTQQTIAEADFILLVLDATVGETPEEATLRDSLAARPHLVVWNKWDLVAEQSEPPFGIPISAATGWNIEMLEDAIAEAVAAGMTAPSQAESAVVTHARHRQALQSALSALTQAQDTLAASLPADFITVDVRGALTVLGEITGETATDDIINEIFSRFCIGK